MSDSDSYESEDDSSGSGNGTSNDHTKEYDELEHNNVKITKSNILDQVPVPEGRGGAIRTSSAPRPASQHARSHLAHLTGDRHHPPR